MRQFLRERLSESLLTAALSPYTQYQWSIREESGGSNEVYLKFESSDSKVGSLWSEKVF